MKDRGFGKIILLTAKCGVAVIDEWAMDKFQRNIRVVFDRNELEGNSFPHDLSDLFRIGDEVEVVAEGQQRRCNAPPRCSKVDVLRHGLAPKPVCVEGIVKPRFFHFNREVHVLAFAELDGKQTKVVVPASSFIPPRETSCHKTFKDFMLDKTVVMMKVVKSSRYQSNFAPLCAVSVRFASDPEAGTLAGGSEADAAVTTTTTATAAGTDVLESAALMRGVGGAGECQHDVATQTTGPAPDLEQQAIVAAKMYIKSATRNDLVVLWTECPELLKRAYSD